MRPTFLTFVNTTLSVPTVHWIYPASLYGGHHLRRPKKHCIYYARSSKNTHTNRVRACRHTVAFRYKDGNCMFSLKRKGWEENVGTRSYVSWYRCGRDAVIGSDADAPTTVMTLTARDRRQHQLQQQESQTGGPSHTSVTSQRARPVGEVSFVVRPRVGLPLPVCPCCRSLHR